MMVNGSQKALSASRWREHGVCTCARDVGTVCRGEPAGCGGRIGKVVERDRTQRVCL